MIAKVNDKLLSELMSGASPALALMAATKQFRGCYTRYVNNYDAAEAQLRSTLHAPEPHTDPILLCAL